MNKNKYNLSAAIAVLLAILFPTYWLGGAFESTSFIQQYRTDVLTLNANDLLFVAIVLSVSLLRRGNEVATLLKMFAVLLIAIALLQVSVFLSVFNVILFPVALLLLAFYFLRSPIVVELV